MSHSNCSEHCGSFTSTPQAFAFTRECDGEAVQIYTAFSKCLPTATIRLTNTGSCPITLIVRQRNNSQTIEIAPNQSIFTSFDCVRVVSVRCSNSPGGTCGFFGDIQIHGCVSCC